MVVDWELHYDEARLACDLVVLSQLEKKIEHNNLRVLVIHTDKVNVMETPPPPPPALKQEQYFS